MKKVFKKNHDYGSVTTKLFKIEIVKELTPFRQPLLALYFNGLLVASSPMSVITLVLY